MRGLGQPKKTEEEKECSVRSKAIRHLIWLGNLLRHGDGGCYTESPDHKELLMEIGSKDSPISSQSSCSSQSSSSNISSVNFNLSCPKHQVKIGGGQIHHNGGEDGGEPGDQRETGELEGGATAEQLGSPGSSPRSQSFGKLSVQAAINNNRVSEKIVGKET